jgi:serine/threonine-protein kinase
MGERYGKYEIVGRIGHGTMGDVYRARDTALNRDVAIKTIADEMGGDETLRKRFLREAQSAARLNHPNIVTVYDFGQDRGKLYMAMELLEGTDLKQSLIKKQIVGLDEKLGVMEQILDGLAFAHANEVIHRDLKPANVFLLPKGKVKIVDFGLARLAGSDMTRTGMVMGTPHYMSPEQVRGEKVDARSDVFSLGCIFYEMLAGRKPFDSETIHAVLFKVLQDDPQPIQEAAPYLPAVVMQLVARALRKDPNERFQNAGEFLQQLRQARQAFLTGKGHEVPAEPRPAGTGSRPSVDAAGLTGAAAGSSMRSRTGSTFGSAPRAAAPRSSAGRWLAIGGGLLALVVVGVGFAVLRERGTPGAAPVVELDPQTRSLVSTQVELARRRLSGGEYKGAFDAAKLAHDLDPKSAEAEDLMKRADGVLAALAAPLAAVEGAIGAGDEPKVASALWDLMEVAPDYSRLRDFLRPREAAFRGRVAEARTRAAQARQAAEGAGAAIGLAEGATLMGEAETAERAGQFGSAVRAYLAAALRFRSARTR